MILQSVENSTHTVYSYTVFVVMTGCLCYMLIIEFDHI